VVAEIEAAGYRLTETRQAMVWHAYDTEPSTIHNFLVPNNSTR